MVLGNGRLVAVVDACSLSPILKMPDLDLCVRQSRPMDHAQLSLRSGTIRLKKELIVRNPRITIAGQTAPGDGITLRDHPLTIAADDVVVRFIRSRLGDVTKSMVMRWAWWRANELFWTMYLPVGLLMKHCLLPQVSNHPKELGRSDGSVEFDC
jgi:hypothetical protein